MAYIEERLGNDVLVVQGSVETYLRGQGFEEFLPFLNLTEPEIIEGMYGLFHTAGADCVVSNTLGATRYQLAVHGIDAKYVAQVNAEGVRLARTSEAPHVLAAMGPCGLTVECGSGEAVLRARVQSAPDAMLAAGEAPGYRAAADEYAEQATALASAGPDAILLESFGDLDDALAAVDAVKRVCDLPILACMTFPADDGLEPASAHAAELLAQAGVAAVGCEGMEVAATVRAVGAMARACGLPVVAIPCAGTPLARKDGTLLWPVGPDGFADASLELLRAGARVIGSGRGSTPMATGAIFATVGNVVF